MHTLQACEMFILELTLRSWSHSEENKRRTLQRNDIAAAITRTDIFDFLVMPQPLFGSHWWLNVCTSQGRAGSMVDARIRTL